MNRVYRVIWSRVLNAWVVVSELARSCTATRRTLRRAAMPTLLALACAQAHATDFYWDGGTVNGGNPAVNANGGAGTWNTALTNFDTALTGGTDVAWTNGDHRAIFPSNGTYTITLGSAITAGDLTSNSSSVTLTGNTLTLTGTPVVDVAGILIISSALDGTVGFSKTGGGTLELSGTKTLTGPIDVVGGRLYISSAWSGTGPGPVTVRNGANLTFAAASALGTDTSAARLVLEGGSVLNANASALYTYDATLTGGAVSIINAGTWNGNFVLTAPTTLTLDGGSTYGSNLADTGANVLSITTGPSGAILNGTNSYTGTTRVSSTLRLASGNALSPNSNLLVAGTAAGLGVIELSNNNLAIALGTGAGQLQFTNTGGFRSIGGNRTVTLNGGAGLTWGSGNFVPAGNAFYLSTDSASSLTFVNPVDLGASARTIQLGSGTGALHAVMSGVVSGAGGGLTLARQSGNGVLELSAANTYTGTTRVGALVNLILNNANALPGGVGATGGTSNLALDGGVVLLRPAAGDFLRGAGFGANQVQWITGGGFAALGGDRTINLGGAGGTVTWNTGNFVPTGSALILGSPLADSMVTFVNPIALGGTSGNLFIDNGSAALDATLTGAISGTGDLLLDGTGDVRLSGTSSFTGPAFLGANAGASSSDNQDVFVSTIGNSGVNGNLGAGSTIALRSHLGSLTYTGAGESINRAWTIGGRNGTTLSLLKSGDGTLRINGASEFQTVHVRDGVLDIAAGGSVQATTTVIDAGATLQLDGAFTGTTGDDSLVIGGTVAGSGTLSLGDGADRLTVQDGANLAGLLAAIDGGAGTDLLETDIATTASLGGVQGFESLLKTGVGVLHVDGPAASAFGSVNVQAGTLDVGAAGVIDGVADTTVANGATLVVDGAFNGTANTDTMVVAGTVRGAGAIGLAAGDDTLTLLDGADLSGLTAPLDGGAGFDTIDAQVQAGTLALAPTVNFEGLSKTGAGTLSLSQSQAFDNVQLVGGTLDVNEGSTLTSAETFVGTGTTLDVHGTFAGTAGDDQFFAAGTVRGALDFGSGNDTIEFALATLDNANLNGGAGNDRLIFRGMALETPLTAIGVERMELRDGSAMTLSTPLATTLAIDASSRLNANAGARIDGAVENAGHIDVGAHRLAITGTYTASAGSVLDLIVSPGKGSAGGLDITGNVLGMTGVRFTSDGTEPMARELRIIDLTNDILGDGGGFVALDADADGQVRLDGTPWLWSFAQDASDRDWYLRTTQETVVPEIPAVAVLHTIGGLPVRDATQRAFGRLNDARTHNDCRNIEDRDARANTTVAADCSGFWMAFSGDQTRVSQGRGYAFTGDTSGVYIGADTQMHDTGARTLRAGWMLGYVDGNHWTDGSVAGVGPVGKGDANIRTHTPMAGFYLGNTWKNDTWLDVMLSAYLHDADVRTNDTQDELRGNTLSMSANLGRRYALGETWTIAPELEIGADAVHWQDRYEFNGMDLNMADGLLGHARTAVRFEREIEMKSGTWRPWMLVGVADTIGEPTVAASLLRMGTSETMQSYANHDLGLQATVDFGVSAKLRTGATAFASLSYAQSLEGTDVERSGAEVGVRWTW